MKRMIALITGASRGIGNATAYEFAKNGYDLVLTCQHSKTKLHAFAQKLKNEFHIQTLCCCGDIGDYEFVRQMFDEIADFGKGVDILINNAGVSYIGLLSEMSYADWNRLLQTNLTSIFACCKFAIPHMLSQKSGKIINVSSDWGLYGASCEAAYSAAKGGVNALTKALAKELAPSGIQVNAAAFGVIDTEMNGCFTESERNQLLSEIPAGYIAPPKPLNFFSN